ncbi:type II toxin-antitoxin system HicA family toxin [Paenibacillus thiaminolyticus]|uniref:type II toxin-antitoxin system HicA family toxin n=1 Tax=Paenibacillus thiaminolyticus TaxID=49283 RepID=UPI002542C513|nr:type II toxin-antitoxin system HicA family toxin [Paenibacillus thiaminolyticus]WII38781.1 type II toxin-antitoxin system HicA family toxin [Paenibacillus thiaminolyticus]
MPSNSSREFIRLVEADGWFLVHIAGSHHQYKHPSKKGKVTISHPKKELPRKTVESILIQAGLI